MTASFVDRLARALPLGRAGFRMLLPLFPAAIESFRLDQYDLVISSSHAVAKGRAPARRRAVRVVRAFADALRVGGGGGVRAARPRRRAGTEGVRAAGGLPAALGRRGHGPGCRAGCQQPYTRARIRRYYGRDSVVIEPPVDTRRFARIPDPSNGQGGAPTYLCVSALVPYKRVELAVRAMAGRRGRLVVVGDGTPTAIAWRAWRRRMWSCGDASTTTSWSGCLPRATAVIHPAIDDFGIVPVEALAAGRPVVAFAEGGVTDTIRDGEGGAVFGEATPASLAAALDRLEERRFEPARLRALARRFDREEFERRFAAWVDDTRRARDARPS